MRKRASHNGGGILFRHNGQKERNPARPAYEVDFAVDGYYIDVQHQQRRDYEFCKTCVKLIPFVLILSERRFKTAGKYLLLYLACFALERIALTTLSDLLSFVVLAMTSIMTRFAPGIMTGAWLLSSTSVSEFIGSMERMHLTEKIVIPLSVIFRFFPTISEEYQAISDAMKMRGIRFGGKNPFLMVEYRLVPLMVSVVKIGDELSAAALTRGLGAPVKRTNVCQIGFHVQDMIAILLCAICFALFLLGQYFSF